MAMAMVEAIQAAAPLSAEQMKKLGQWGELSNADVAALMGAMGIPSQTKCAPVIISSVDAVTLKEVGREVKEVHIKPFDAGGGNFVHITVPPHRDPAPPARTFTSRARWSTAG